MSINNYGLDLILLRICFNIQHTVQTHKPSERSTQTAL